MTIKLAQRDRQPEFMDQPGLDRDEHARALAGLRRINFISGTSASLLAPIENWQAKEKPSPCRFLNLPAAAVIPQSILHYMPGVGD